MRVITGTARGRKLKTPENYDIRPTTDNVKESLFNILQFDIEGRQVLDLFAETGQLGIECLSRGAAHCTFVDQRREDLDILAHRSESAMQLLMTSNNKEIGRLAAALEAMSPLKVLGRGFSLF